MSDEGTIAVIGAGMAGAACARALEDAGRRVVVFDKGREVGGRLAQRRAGEAVFDHGAQYLSARDPAFSAAVAAWEEAGLVAAWPEVRSGRGDPVRVGVPAMNAPVRHLLHGLPVHSLCRIAGLTRGRAGWTLVDEAGRRHGAFPQAAIAIPASQALALLRTADEPALAPLEGKLAEVRMAPCWSGLVAFAGRIQGAHDSYRRDDGVLAWCARNTSKPGRGEVESWTLHATPSWSRDHLEQEPAAVIPPLLDAFAELTEVPLPLPVHLAAHRWRYSMVEEPLGKAALVGSDLVLCGDWCLGPRVEAAWLSGRAAAAAIA